MFIKIFMGWISGKLTYIYIYDLSFCTYNISHVTSKCTNTFTYTLSWYTCSNHLNSVQFSHSVISDSAAPWTAADRPPCPSPTPRVYSNPYPLSWGCHPTISSSVVPFSSHLPSFTALGSFQKSQFSTSGGQSIDHLVYVLTTKFEIMATSKLTIYMLYKRLLRSKQLSVRVQNRVKV